MQYVNSKSSDRVVPIHAHRLPHLGAMPHWLLVLIAVALLLLTSHTFPPVAYAAVWPTSGAELSPTLGFRQVYEVNGTTYTHYGIDIAAEAGSTVMAPVDGTVSFVGAVPSGLSSVTGGGNGQTMQALSILMSDGRTVTLMPFESIGVGEGTAVAQGSALGVLASTGDRSSSSPHVHLGLKKGNTYYDPMTLFSAAAATPLVQESEEAAPAEVFEGLAPSSAFAQEQAAPAEELVEVGGIQADEELGSITSGDVVWQGATDTNSAGETLLEQVGAAVDAFANACASQLQAFQEGLDNLAQRSGVSAGLIITSAASATLAFGAIIAVLFAAVLLPAVRRARNKLGKALQSENWGDTIRKLFPAPGTPS